MENEIWKGVPGYENLYQVSNFGRTKSLRKFHSTGSKNGYWREEKVTKLVTNNTGYHYITLSIGNVKKKMLVHRLVAILFIPIVDGKDVVNHINGITTDNTVSNLEWCTAAENNLHAYRILGRKGPQLGIKGSSSPFAKKVIQYSLSGIELNRFDSLIDAEKHTNIRRTGISACICGRYAHSGGFMWKEDCG